MKLKNNYVVLVLSIIEVKVLWGNDFWARWHLKNEAHLVPALQSIKEGRGNCQRLGFEEKLAQKIRDIKSAHAKKTPPEVDGRSGGQGSQPTQLPDSEDTVANEGDSATKKGMQLGSSPSEINKKDAKSIRLI